MLQEISFFYPRGLWDISHMRGFDQKVHPCTTNSFNCGGEWHRPYVLDNSEQDTYFKTKDVPKYKMI